MQTAQTAQTVQTTEAEGGFLAKQALLTIAAYVEGPEFKSLSAVQ
jgi:hypothetical protein